MTKRRKTRPGGRLTVRNGRRARTMAVRKNQGNLTNDEWTRLVAAIKALHGMVPQPSYRAFVSVHVQAMSSAGMDCAVHTMMMGGVRMSGRNFLSWHLQYMAQFEKRLQQVEPSVTIPYWDWTADRAIPAPLAVPEQPAISAASGKPGMRQQRGETRQTVMQ